MIKINNLKLSLNDRKKIGGYNIDTDSDFLYSLLENKYKIKKNDIKIIKILKESIDARKNLEFIISIALELKNKKQELNLVKIYKLEEYIDQNSKEEIIKNKSKQRPIIIGFGPAGIFAALSLINSNIKPIIIERGSEVDKREIVVETFIKEHILNENCNVQFGEGGAGTFSDAKLSTGIKNPNISYILKQLVKFGAPDNILYKNLPHIGTDIIRKVVKNIRKYLITKGADFYFDTQLIDIIVNKNTLQGVIVKDNYKTFVLECNKLILAIGHSARDTIEMLYKHGLNMKQKPFAIGLRIEHLQSEVNLSRYHCCDKFLPAASYNVNAKTPDGRGVYSFCMCPGGEVIMASSEKNSIVVNGMSYYSRNNINANSAILVGIKTEDFDSDSVLAGFELQRKIERQAFKLVGNDYLAPVETVSSFLYNKQNYISDIVPSCRNGYKLVRLKDCLPEFIYNNIKYAMPYLSKKLPCFSNEKAIFTGVETRSSSPVKIIRDDNGQTSIKGIYGCGEGAGYAGGIMSAAADGIRIANNLYKE